MSPFTVHTALPKVPRVSGRGEEHGQRDQGPHAGSVVVRGGHGGAKAEASAHEERSSSATGAGEGEVDAAGGVARDTLGVVMRQV